MTDDDRARHEADQFLRDSIDTVPHLEALLLLWNSPSQPLVSGGHGEGVVVAPDAAKEILKDLVRQRLIIAVPGARETYQYESERDRDQLIAATDSTYQRELIRVSRLIHSKPSAAVREFALSCSFAATARSKRSCSCRAAFALWVSQFSNILVSVDLVMFPDVNLYRWRLATAAVAMILLLYGLTWESE